MHLKMLLKFRLGFLVLILFSISLYFSDEEKSIYDAEHIDIFSKFGGIKSDAMKNIVLKDTAPKSLSYYLALEEEIAGGIDEEAIFVWQSPPTVIIGRNQDLEAEVNIEYCREHGIDVVRRKSGGGCVYSDEGNIMISVISPRAEAAEVFDRYLSALSGCLRSLGLDAVKSGRNDVLVGGFKVSGNAVRQLPDRTIVHGTLLFSTDLDALENAIRPPVEKLERHGIQSVRQRVANLSDYLGPEWTVERLKSYLVQYFVTPR